MSQSSSPKRRNNAGTSEKGAPRSPSRGPAEKRPAPRQDSRADQERPARNSHAGQGRSGNNPKNGPGERRPGGPRAGFRKPDAPRADGPVRPMPAQVKHAAGHPMCRPLFSPLDAFCRNALAQLPKALDTVMPLSRNHRADLPEAIRDLSAMLTYERGGLGDVTVKKFLNSVMQEELRPIRERREMWAGRLPEVYEMLRVGSEKARAKAAQTLAEVRHAMRIDYFEDGNLLK